VFHRERKSDHRTIFLRGQNGGFRQLLAHARPKSDMWHKQCHLEMVSRTLRTRGCPRLKVRRGSEPLIGLAGECGHRQQQLRIGWGITLGGFVSEEGKRRGQGQQFMGRGSCFVRAGKAGQGRRTYEDVKMDLRKRIATDEEKKLLLLLLGKDKNNKF
jgi:hypothetical protein